MTTLEADLAAAGFDLVRWFNTASLEDPDLCLEDFGRATGALAVVIGNSRALWSPFLRDRSGGANPLDSYAESKVTAACARRGSRFVAQWAHVVRPRAIPIQRISQASGLAQIGPAGLCVHPVHGLWIALRAVVVFDEEGPPDCTSAPDLCGQCAGQPCVPATARALKLGAAASWRDWLEVRDACPVGRESRYGESQIEYHYTKNPAALDRDT
jgi:methylmalonic aciduria homocystinuria type C protein